MTREKSNAKPESSPANDLGLSPQQVMEAGQAAARLLNQPVYNLAHRAAIDEIIENWAQTQPKETNRRESLWHELQALARGSVRLASLVNRAEEMLERQASQGARDQQDNLDTQGFGVPPEYSTGESFQ